jgi:hypothetical protein
MERMDYLKGDLIPWLLEAKTPGVSYLTLRDLLDCPGDDPDLLSARNSAYTQGPIAEILANMNPEGYWVEPGPGYNPKYRSTVWAVILLAQLGASAQHDERVAKACAYILDNNLTALGQFTITGAPSGTVDCLQGNLCWSLVEMGCDDPRLELAYEWMARSLTGEGVAPSSDRQAALRYYAGKCGPLFACGANNRLACAWGATKVMLAFSAWTENRRTPLIRDAIEQGAGFLLGTDPADANYPSGWSDKPSGNWWKFGFPVFYVTDLLQVLEAMVGLGYGRDPRLENALQIVRDKQDSQRRWALEYDYSGKTWVNFGAKKKPNKWVSLRALRVLKAIEG